MSARASGRERPAVFRCEGDALCGILHPGVGETNSVAVVVIVGGPQYRAGCHRQFVLLARDLAAAGYPVLRFDCRGMGDSEGRPRDFEQMDADVQSAIDTLQREEPGVQEVVLWGLCDAASAAAFYGWQDERVTGMILLNPWVRTQAGEARTQIRHYYRERLMDPAFWRKLLVLRWNPLRSLREFLESLVRARASDEATTGGGRAMPFPERMRAGLTAFDGRVLLVLSGRDLTAREFEDTVEQTPAWKQWLDRSDVQVVRVAEADHTFSRRSWRDRVAEVTRAWLEAA